MRSAAPGGRRQSNVSAIRRYNSEGHELSENVPAGVMPRDMSFLEQKRLREEEDEKKKERRGSRTKTTISGASTKSKE